VPEYFAEYRDKGDGLAAFLGSSIVAKVCHYTYLGDVSSYRIAQIVFNDAYGKHFVSKAEYTSKGPRAVVEKSPSLL